MEQDIKDLMEEEIDLIKAEEQESLPKMVSVSETTAVAEANFAENTAAGIVNTTKNKILKQAEQKINNEKVIGKHSTKLAEIADSLMKVEEDAADLEVQRKDADNKADKQEITNRLIVLKNEAKRLRKAEKHKNKLQKIEIETEKKQKRWDMLESTLKPLGYDYVPNFIALHILLMLVGLKAFFNGIGQVGAAVLKCVKWFLFIGLVIAIVMIIPVTRAWILGLLGFLR